MWAGPISSKVVVTTQVEWTGRSFIKGEVNLDLSSLNDAFLCLCTVHWVERRRIFFSMHFVCRVTYLGRHQRTCGPIQFPVYSDSYASY